jgi:RNA polymerase sigma-70 factor (ECF subfamily)
VPTAGKPLAGGERVARVLVGFARANAKSGRESSGRFVRVNGAPGLVVIDGETTSVFSLTIDAGRIVALDVVRNPDKLGRLATPEAGA